MRIGCDGRGAWVVLAAILLIANVAAAAAQDLRARGAYLVDTVAA